MSKSQSVVERVVGGGGLTFNSMLAVLFIGLKLGSVIDWSWWWVLSPLWGPLAIALLLGLLLGIVWAIVKVAFAVIARMTS